MQRGEGGGCRWQEDQVKLLVAQVGPQEVAVDLPHLRPCRFRQFQEGSAVRVYPECACTRNPPKKEELYIVPTVYIMILAHEYSPDIFKLLNLYVQTLPANLMFFIISDLLNKMSLESEEGEKLLLDFNNKIDYLTDTGFFARY